MSPLGNHKINTYDKGDQPSDGEATWTNTGGTRSGGGQRKTGYLGRGMPRHSTNHETLDESI